MKAYELLVLLNPTLDEDARETAVGRVQEVITNDGGTIDSVDSWGKRKLAYEIDKLTDGDYVLFNFHTEPSAIAELDRVLHIADPVVRYMIVAREDRE